MVMRLEQRHPVNVSDVARYILFKGSQEEEMGNDISNMKLQKLLYYSQGFGLALDGIPCFHEQIVAWPHGPVVLEVYEEYKAFGAGVIPPPENFNPNSLEDSVRELVDEVYEVYGQFSAWKLRNMTHEETPWLETPANQVISHQAMREFFETRVREA